MTQQKTEQTFVIGIFGDNFELRKIIGQALGAPSSKSDIQVYDRLDNSLGYIFSAYTPIDYPEKLKPFLQILNLTDIHILSIDLETGLNAAIGEILIAMDLVKQLKIVKQLIVIGNINEKTEWKLPEIRKNIKKVIETTSLRDVNIIEIKEKEDFQLMKKRIIELGLELIKEKNQNQAKNDDRIVILIDHVFPVKGIGTVALGIVKEGILHAGQMLELVDGTNNSRKVIIRSIQKQDRDYKEAYEGDRIGVALKGINPDEVSRDNILATPGIFHGVNELVAELHVSPFYKPKSGKIIPNDGDQYHAISFLKMVPLKIIDGNEIEPGQNGIVKFELDKPLYHDGRGLKGFIVKLNRFQNKLRIVGIFFQKID